jgi:hypothetical protein
VRADTVVGKVWIVFTLVNSTREFAEDVAAQMKERVGEAALSGDDARITAA